MLAWSPGCTYPVLSTGQPDLLHHAYPGWLPARGCGIATCLNRAIGMTGLSPAGSRPCRLLLTPVTPEAHLSVMAVIVRIDAPVFPSVGEGRQLHCEFRGYIQVRCAATRRFARLPYGAFVRELSASGYP
jgi:hypothetical protein